MTWQDLCLYTPSTAPLLRWRSIMAIDQYAAAYWLWVSAGSLAGYPQTLLPEAPPIVPPTSWPEPLALRERIRGVVIADSVLATVAAQDLDILQQLGAYFLGYLQEAAADYANGQSE